MAVFIQDLKVKLTSPTSNLFWQIVRYGISGGIAFVADFVVLWLLTEFVGWYYLVSAVCGNLVGLIITYLMSVVWVFDQRRLSNHWAEFAGFTLIAGLGMGLTELFMYIFTEYVFIEALFGPNNYLISKLVTAFIVACVNFVLKKTFLFSKKR